MGKTNYYDVGSKCELLCERIYFNYNNEKLIKPVLEISIINGNSFILCEKTLDSMKDLLQGDDDEEK